jgi:hypothetical protein
MSESFTAAELVPANLPQALPLLRATWPEIDLATWQGFAENFRRDHRTHAALIGLFDTCGGLCGLFASCIEHDLRGGQILAVPLFTVVDIGNSLKPVRALAKTAEARAKNHSCRSLEIRLTSEQGELIKRLRSLGFGYSGTTFSSPTATALRAC